MSVKPNSWIQLKHRTQYQIGAHHVLESWQASRNECHEEALDGDPVRLIAYVCYDSPRVAQRGDSLNKAELVKEMSALFYGGNGDDQGNILISSLHVYHESISRLRAFHVAGRVQAGK